MGKPSSGPKRPDRRDGRPEGLFCLEALSFRRRRARPLAVGALVLAAVVLGFRASPFMGGVWFLAAGLLLIGYGMARACERRVHESAVRSVLASLEEGVVVADRTGRLAFSNEAAGRILGLRPDRASPGRWASTWGCRLDERTPCPEAHLPLARALAGETVPAFPLFVQNAGVVHGRWVSMSAVPLRGTRDQLTGAVSVLRDVSVARASEYQRIEVQLASAVQRNLYPRAAPRLEGFDLAGAVFSAEATCGDYFDFIPISDDVLAIAIGDVSGHGMAPALVMTQVRAYLRAFAHSMEDPGQILERMNRLLAADLRDGYFVTLLVVFLDLGTGRLRYVNAGHVPGQLIDSAGNVRATLSRTGLPLGLVPERGGYTVAEARVAPGETLVLMTDGFVESRDAAGEMLSEEGALQIVTAHLGERAADIVETIYERVHLRAGGKPLSDDLAMVVLKSVRGIAPPVPRARRQEAPSPEGTISRRAR